MNLAPTYDIVIIGAGPAACAAALTLKQHAPALSILLLNDSRRRHRVVESLSPQAGVLLRRLGVWPRFLAENFLPTFSTSSVWGSDIPYDNEFIYQTEGRGWHLDREQFDKLLLLEVLEAGGECWTNAQYTGHESTPSGFTLTVKKAGTTSSIKASFVLDASGRNAAFAKKEGAEKRFSDRLVGVFGIFEPIDQHSSSKNGTMIEAVKQGWWYASKTTGHQMAIAFMSDADLTKAMGIRSNDLFIKHLNNTLHLKERVLGYRFLKELTVFPAGSFALSKLVGERWAAIGDSAYTLDPLSSSGVLKALRSGTLGAYVTLDFFKDKGNIGLEKYSNMMTAEHQTYLETQRAFYQEEQRWPTAEFWQRRTKKLLPNIT